MLDTTAVVRRDRGAEPTVPPLSVARFFTVAGRHPFDEVEWERRTIITKAMDGTKHEEKNCEFPVFWSTNASNIAGSKYFRGRLGSETRERSVRQMIGRVAAAIRGWGLEFGYFSDAPSADAFADELTHLLLYQKAAFNSPVWFNVGVDPKPQCSACQPYRALVSTPGGFYQIGEIVEGNLVGLPVYDSKGITHVVAVKNNGMKAVYRIGLRNGTFVEATGDHLVKAVSERRTEPQWVRVDRLRAGMRLHLFPHRSILSSAASTAFGMHGHTAALVQGGGTVTCAIPQLDVSEIAVHEAALAGWLQADGFVGQYRTGTNRSLTMEFVVVTGEERQWVESHLDAVFPGIHRKVRITLTKAGTPVTRIRLYGDGLRHFVEKYELLRRRQEIRVPGVLWRSRPDAIAAYVRSIFQSEGYVAIRGTSARVAIAMISTDWVRDLQVLLYGLGIYSRICRKRELRGNRLDLYELAISNGSERQVFAERIGFLSAAKQERLLRSLAFVEQKRVPDLREEEIVSLKAGADEAVYDIQTASGEYLTNNVAVHNCFILEVEDTIESILEWYYTEGLIFRGGSGSGVDLSPLRSSREKLSRGGYSSGPVSFMRGADSVAGAIASGGSTRRAAKMVVLRIDHPDILSFIRCKAEEEKKVRALMASGYDMTDLNNDGWKSIQYQNANNSVRVPDEFMRAVEEDGTWATRLVTTGEVNDEFRARELLREIAQAAWETGDPGMQFDTTINDWNTAAVTGRITATNPCVTGDTLVATRYGWREIHDLVGTTPIIATPAGWQRAVRVWQTGIQPIYKLTTRAGYNLRLTADHPVFVPGRGDVPAHALQAGDAVALQGAGFGGERLPEAEAFAIGYSVGDGCIFTAARTGNPVFTATGGLDDRNSLEVIAGYINDTYHDPDRMGRTIPPVHVTQATTGLKVASSRPRLAERLTEFAVLDARSKGKRFTPHAFALDRASQAALLRGLFTADGTVSGNTEKGYYVGLDSTSLVLLEQVQLLLLNFGIKAKLHHDRRRSSSSMILDSDRNPKEYPTQPLHSLRVTRQGRLRFEQAVDFSPGSIKSEKLREINWRTACYREDLADTIADIRPDGIEPVYDLTEPVTSHFVANGIVVHNCAEYIHLNNSACNLASINLLAFLADDGTFRVEEFRHAVRVMILAQDILVDGSSYPTEKIAKNAHDFRELGLGYANLGALLMALGMPYDSEPACATAAAITALMCGEAYRYSGVIAQALGPCAGFAANREPTVRVLGKHRAALARVRRDQVFDPRIYDAAAEAWDGAVALGETVGVRNSQVTLIAPTGTISFMMDCDTTGIEPDFALVKMKTLVGGGVMKIVNRTVPRALRRLGYAEPEVADIIGSIEERGTIEGAPRLAGEHLAVFDCAVKPAAGSRAISWQGHVRMVAAVQPFVSGGISKTFNMPHETTVEEIMEAYLMAWRMGIKVFAVYRDGSKAAQPLVTLSGKGGAAGSRQSALPIAPARRRLPPTRGSETHKFSVAGHEGYLTYGMYEDGSLAEMFIRMHKTGSTMAGLLDAFAITVSIALQHGVPLKELARKFIYGRYEPAGFTQNPDIQVATSITDYIFRYLSLRFLAREELAELGMNGHAPLPAETIGHGEVPRIEATEAMPIYADSVCRSCGGMMIQTGSCKTCLQCGNTTGGC